MGRNATFATYDQKDAHFDGYERKRWQRSSSNTKWINFRQEIPGDRTQVDNGDKASSLHLHVDFVRRTNKLPRKWSINKFQAQDGMLSDRENERNVTKTSFA